MKKILSLALCLAMCAALFAVPASAATEFSDLDAGAWYYDAVLWAAENGVTAGDGAGHFNPQGILTNAEAIQFIYNVKATEAYAPGEHWYTPAQNWGIDGGYISANTIMGAKCTRIEFVKMFYAAAGSPDTSIENPFTDTEEKAAIWAYDVKLAAGDGAGHFYPNDELSRASVVQFLYNNYTAETAGSVIGMPNPMAEYSSLEEINDATGGNLKKPGVAGVDAQSYWVYDTDPKLAEYQFMVNGVSYSFRFSSNLTDDISGVYTDNGSTAFAGSEVGSSDYYDGGDTKAARFFTVDGQYVLVAQDCKNMTMDTFRGIAEELKSLVVRSDSDEDYEQYVGYWVETVAGRGTIETSYRDGAYYFSVTWPNSAAERYETTFSGTMENGVVTYANGVSKSFVFGDDGNVSSETTRYEKGEGSVTFNSDGTLTWIETGYNSEGSVFAKSDII